MKDEQIEHHFYKFIIVSPYRPIQRFSRKFFLGKRDIAWEMRSSAMLLTSKLFTSQHLIPPPLAENKISNSRSTYVDSVLYAPIRLALDLCLQLRFNQMSCFSKTRCTQLTPNVHCLLPFAFKMAKTTSHAHRQK